MGGASKKVAKLKNKEAQDEAKADQKKADAKKDVEMTREQAEEAITESSGELKVAEEQEAAADGEVQRYEREATHVLAESDRLNEIRNMTADVKEAKQRRADARAAVKNAEGKVKTARHKAAVAVKKAKAE